MFLVLCLCAVCDALQVLTYKKRVTTSEEENRTLKTQVTRRARDVTTPCAPHLDHTLSTFLSSAHSVDFQSSLTNTFLCFSTVYSFLVCDF